MHLIYDRKTPMKHQSRFILLIILPFLLLSLSGCPNDQPNSIVQIIFQPNTDELATLTDDILYSVSKRVRPKHWVEISILKDKEVNVLFSNIAKRQTFQEIRARVDGDPTTKRKLEKTNSSEEALVEGIQRLRDRINSSPANQEIHFYIVTSGTDDPVIIAQISSICGSLSERDLSNVHLYLIGLDEERLAFSNAFSPIGEKVESSSSNYSEWSQLIRKF